MFNLKKVAKLKREIERLNDMLIADDDLVAEFKDKADTIEQYYKKMLHDKNEQIRLQELRIEVLTRTSEIKKEKVKEPKLVAKDLKTGKFIKRI